MLERFDVRRGVGMLASGVLAFGAAAGLGGCNTPMPMTYPDTGVDSSVVGDSGRDTGAPDTNTADANTADTNAPDMGVDSGVVLHARTTATNGSAIVLSSDDTVLVACNRQAGSVSIFSVTAGSPPTLGTPTELAFAGDEPWAAVIGNDDDTAYVILRRAQQVVRIDHLHTTPTIAATRGTTGSEPTGIAISPLGTTLWVANWGEGTLTRFAANDLTMTQRVDLNASLVATGSLGTVTARPGLAHPRAIVMTNNGDMVETDETIYVTEYFAQTRTDTLPVDDSRFDLERRGIVYRVDGTGTPQAAIALMPVASTGFLDSTSTTPTTGVTGCYPNQLLAAALNSGRLYVTAVCASPRGPVGPVIDMTTGMATSVANFKTQIHTGIFVVDTATNAELPAQGMLLTQRFQAMYDAASPAVPDDSTRRIPLIVNDIAFLGAGPIAYMPGYGSDAVFRVVYNADGTFNSVGAATQRFINLSPAGAGMPVGRLPYGIALAHASPFAFTINEHTRNVSIISLATQTTVAAAQSTALPAAGTPAAGVLDGRRFFVTGLGRWSFRGQAWNSCESCHGDGLTDTVTWYFGRGPRQSISLDGTFSSTDPTQQRLLNWGAIFDEVHDFENNTRGNSGGVGAVVQTGVVPPAATDRIQFDGSILQAGQVASTHLDNGLNGSVSTELMPTGSDTVHSALADWDRVTQYIQSIRSPRAPTTLVAADVTAGAALFATANCASCHGTGLWTISRRFWAPDEAHNNPATGSLRSTSYMAPALFPALLNPPSMAAGRMATLRFPLGPTAAGNDQIQCILRAVGTFAAAPAAVLPAGSTVQLREVRQDMTTNAQGASGFNPPSLLDSVASAPYFHGGNARTLEEVFDPTFAAHYQALDSVFLPTATQIGQLVAFLLSIDESTTAVTPPSLGFDAQLCPNTL